MEIKIAQRLHFPQLAKLRWNFKIEDGEAPALGREEFEKIFVAQLEAEEPHWKHFIAQTADEIVGMASIYRIGKLLGPGMRGDSIGYLTNVYVIPSLRAQGIGGKLLRAGSAWAEKNNLELLFVWPSDLSRSLYERAGFQEKNEIMELLFP